MGKWVVNKIGKEQVWYSADVIEKILRVVNEHSCEYCDDLCGCAVGCTPAEIKRIIDEIEKED